MELGLYCEHDSGWHATAHSLYRFRLNQEWVEKLGKHWATLAAVTKRLGPLAKVAGWAVGMVGVDVEFDGMESVGKVVEGLQGEGGPALDHLVGELKDKEGRQAVGIETIHVLKDLD